MFRLFVHFLVFFIFKKEKKRVSIGIPKFYGKDEDSLENMKIVSPLMKILNLNFVVAQKNFSKRK